jgi:hypothetical protein
VSRFNLCNCPAGVNAEGARHAPDCPSYTGLTARMAAMLAVSNGLRKDQQPPRNAVQKKIAVWSISLDTECPQCGHSFDMLCTDDFWEGKKFTAVEHGTDRTENVEAYCPKCAHEFSVDLAY